MALERLHTYEVGIFNKRVRDLTSQGKRDRVFDESWGDIHYFEVEAASPEEARRKIARRYPADQGFVVESVDAPKF